jgi:hypothetical protein
MTSPNLKRGLIMVMLIKVSVVLLAAFFVFGPHQRPLIDRNALDRQILQADGKQEQD